MELDRDSQNWIGSWSAWRFPPLITVSAVCQNIGILDIGKIQYCECLDKSILYYTEYRIQKSIITSHCMEMGFKE